MKYRIDDPKVFEILKRNHISYWPDVRSYGSDARALTRHGNQLARWFSPRKSEWEIDLEA